ncbi:MAG: nucleotide-binding protein, partial [Acidobacteria bacterium]|nr:nucleotide-binding protein [Acidobacteriota bacterium]
MSRLPALFVGSSSEGLTVARAIQTQLQHDTEVTVWNEGAFPLGQTTLEGLVNALDRFDFAVLLLTPDDAVVSRQSEHLAPRDNLLFELGLFMGRLGRSRTFVVCENSSRMKLPSDLAGVTVARYTQERADGNLLAAVGPACDQIRKAIRDLGLTEGRTAQRLQSATAEMEHVTETMAHLIHLLARSRVVELDIVDKQLGGMIRSDFLSQLRIDLEDLAKATKQAHTKPAANRP